VFGPGDRPSRIVLEVWHDAGRPVEISEAELVVTELAGV
jgi:hypothetical protein